MDCIQMCLHTANAVQATLFTSRPLDQHVIKAIFSLSFSSLMPERRGRHGKYTQASLWYDISLITCRNVAADVHANHSSSLRNCWLTSEWELSKRNATQLSQLHMLFERPWPPVFGLRFLQAPQQDGVRILMIGSALCWRSPFTFGRKRNQQNLCLVSDCFSKTFEETLSREHVH